MLIPWKESYDKPRQHIKKQRHYFVNKGSSSQGYGFSSGHVWMLELDYKESWAPKNWCFWAVLLEKTLESPLDCKEIQPVHQKEIIPGCSLEGLMLKLKLQYFGHLMQRADSFEKTLMLGKIEGWRKRGTTENEIIVWHHWLNGPEFGWTPGVGDGLGGLVVAVHGVAKSWTWLSDWTGLNWTEMPYIRLLSRSALSLWHRCIPQPTRLLGPWGFSRQECCTGLPCPLLGHLPYPGIEPSSPTLQADSLLSEPPGKP